MARLTDEEREELLRATRGRTEETGTAPDCIGSEPPRSRLLTPLEYIEFATFASRFDRSAKPVAFGGEHWKL
jgi:hypothetical protein